MKIIFVNWTKPFFHRDKFNGYKKDITIADETDDYKLQPYELYMQLAAITSAKKYGGVPIKLYTDTVGYEYYKKVGFIDLFDEIDVDVLNKLDKTLVNPAQFWTSGKIFSICHEKPPFVFLDLDLIIKTPLPKWLFNYDVVHTHWEMLRGHMYIHDYQLNDVKLHMPEFEERMAIPNTSFLFVNNKLLLNKYRELHMRIVNKTYDNVLDWLWLMSDQNILGYTIRHLDLKVGDIENRLFIQFADPYDNRFKQGYISDWMEYEGTVRNTPKIEYDHIWLKKSHIVNNEEYRTERINEWTHIVITNGYKDYLNLLRI
jgi:hypothetical protein